MRNHSVSRALLRNDSQGSISSLFGNYGFVKLEDPNDFSHLKKIVPSITNRKINLKTKKEIENLLKTRKLHESAV